MPRIPRGVYEKQILHVTNRGVERRPIFSKPQDYAFFLTQTRESFADLGISLLSYCLMPNHFHLLVGVVGNALSRAMQTLQTRYSMYFNRVYDRVGHLFQDRFRSIEVNDLDYLSWLPVYIHMNPVKAKLVSKPALWEWSGHNELLSPNVRYLDLPGLEPYGVDPVGFKTRYAERLREFTRPLPPSASLQAILEWCSMQSGIRWQDLLAGATGGPFTRAKLLLLHSAQERGYCVTDVAALLGCAPTGLYRMSAQAAQQKGQTL